MQVSSIHRTHVDHRPYESKFEPRGSPIERYGILLQAGRPAGWGGRDRTSEWRNQNPLPYRLATPQQAPGNDRTQAVRKTPLLRCRSIGGVGPFQPPGSNFRGNRSHRRLAAGPLRPLRPVPGSSIASHDPIIMCFDGRSERRERKWRPAAPSLPLPGPSTPPAKALQHPTREWPTFPARSIPARRRSAGPRFPKELRGHRFRGKTADNDLIPRREAQGP